MYACFAFESLYSFFSYPRPKYTHLIQIVTSSTILPLDLSSHWPTEQDNGCKLCDLNTWIQCRLFGCHLYNNNNEREGKKSKGKGRWCNKKWIPDRFTYWHWTKFPANHSLSLLTISLHMIADHLQWIPWFRFLVFRFLSFPLLMIIRRAWCGWS